MTFCDIAAICKNPLSLPFTPFQKGEKGGKGGLFEIPPQSVIMDPDYSYHTGRTHTRRTKNHLYRRTKTCEVRLKKRVFRLSVLKVCALGRVRLRAFLRSL